jgi:hypothetical protein
VVYATVRKTKSGVSNEFRKSQRGELYILLLLQRIVPRMMLDRAEDMPDRRGARTVGGCLSVWRKQRTWEEGTRGLHLSNCPVLRCGSRERRDVVAGVLGSHACLCHILVSPLSSCTGHFATSFLGQFDSSTVFLVFIGHYSVLCRAEDLL